MTVKQIRNGSTHSLKGGDQRRANDKINICIDQIHHLRKADKDGSCEKALLNFRSIVVRGEQLTGNQLSFLNDIYDKTLNAMTGMKQSGRKHDTVFKMKF